MIEYLVLLTIPLAVYGGGIYFIETIAGRAKPNKVTWLFWAVAPLIASFAAMSKGVTWAALPIFLTGFVPLCIFIVSLFVKKAYWKLSAFDYFCGIFALLALVLWWLTKDANIAIIFSIISDLFACIPTFKKSWTNPETEPVIPYIVGLVSVLTSFAAIKYWIFSEYAFAVYIVIVDACLIFVIIRTKIFAKIILFTNKK